MRKGTQQLLVSRSRGSQNRIDRIPNKTFQKATIHAIVTFQMSDLRFDRAATFAAFLFRSREIAGAASGEMNVGITDVIVAAITFIDVSVAHAHTSIFLDRSDRPRQCVTVVGIPCAQRDADNPVPRLVVATDIFWPNSNRLCALPLPRHVASGS